MLYLLLRKVDIGKCDIFVGRLNFWYWYLELDRFSYFVIGSVGRGLDCLCESRFCFMFGVV